jgi:hypothetical protein
MTVVGARELQLSAKCRVLFLGPGKELPAYERLLSRVIRGRMD